MPTAHRDRRSRALALLDTLLAEADGTRTQRGTECLADFTSGSVGPVLGGYDEALAFCVPEFFAEGLDVRTSTRRVDGETREVRTQGTSFAFAAGAILYSHPAAYHDDWQTALRSVDACLQVVDAEPAGRDDGGTRNRGRVTFHLLRPTPNRDALVVAATRTMTQDEFVRILIEGA